MENIEAPPVQASASFLTPLLISMLGIVCTSMAILAYHFILVKYCLRSWTRRQQTTNTMSQDLQRPIPDRCLEAGLDPKILETIPVIAYSTRKSRSLFRVDQIECAVCLGELEEGDMVRLLPICRHAFHVPCIDKWFSAHTSCPVCRCPTNVSTNHDLVPPFPTSDDDSNSNELTSSSTSRSLIPSVSKYSHPCPLTSIPRAEASSSGVHSCNMLQKCISLALPKERRSSSRRVITGLKRSLSMDQSFVIVDLQRECHRECSSSSSTFTRSVSNRAWSIRHFDLVSSKLLQSLSQLRAGKGSGILPY